MHNKSKPQLTLVINNEGMFKNKECRMYSRLPMKSMGGLRQSKVKLRERLKDMNGVESRKEVKIKYENSQEEGRVRNAGEEGNKRLKRLRMEKERKGGGLNRSCGDISGYGKRKEEKGGVSESNKSNNGNSNGHYNHSDVHNITTNNKNKNTNGSYIQLYSIKHKTHISLICDKFINIKANSFSNINTNTNNYNNSNSKKNSCIVNNNNSKFNILSIVNNSCFEIHNNNNDNTNNSNNNISNNQPLPPPNKSRTPHSPPNPAKKSQCKFDSFDSMYFSSSIHINQAPPDDQQFPLLNNNITITEREFISNPHSTRKHPPFAVNRPTLHPIQLPCANVSQDTIDVPLSSLRTISPSFETVLTELTTNAVCIMNLFNQHKSSFTNEVLLLLNHLMNQNVNYISQLTQLNKSKVVEYKLDYLTKNNNMCITLLNQVHVITTCNLIQNILKENIDVITEIKHSHSNNN